MRTSIILLALSLVRLSSIISAMDKPKPAYARSWIGRIIHLADQEVDPKTYLTTAESIEACQMVLRLNPNHQKSLPFSRDTIWLGRDGYVAKAVRRQKKLLLEVETDIFGDSLLTVTGYQSRPPSDTGVEDIIKAYKKIGGYYSEHVLAVLKGFCESKNKHSAEIAGVLRRLDFSLTVPTSEQDSHVAANSTEPKTSQKPPYQSNLTYEKYTNLVLKDNPTLLQKANNKVRKTWYTPSHLTHSKTADLSEQILRFDPEHPGHDSSDWHLNPHLPLHHHHVHKTFERERYLLEAIAEAIENNDINTINTLNFVKADDETAITIPSAYFSPVLKALIAADIHYRRTQSDKQQNPSQRQLDVAQKEEADKKAAALAELKKKELEEQEAKQKLLKETHEQAAQEQKEEQKRAAKETAQRLEAEIRKGLEQKQNEAKKKEEDLLRAAFEKAEQEKAQIKAIFEKAEQEKIAQQKHHDRVTTAAIVPEQPQLP